MAEVRRVGRQLGGDHDLPLVDGQLRVVALQRLIAVRSHRPRVMVGQIDQAGRHEHRLVRLDHPRRHPPRAVRGDTPRAPGVIGGVRGVLDIKLFLQAPARLKQPVSPVPGDRAALALALGFQPAAPLTHLGAPALRAGDEPTGIELNRHRALVVNRRLRSIVAFARQALLGLAQRPAPALARA